MTRHMPAGTTIDVAVRTPVHMAVTVIATPVTLLVFPALLGPGLATALMTLGANLIVSGIAFMVGGFAGLAVSGAIFYFIEKNNLSPACDVATLHHDRLVLRKRGAVYFSEIAAYGMDNMLTIKRSQRGRLLVGQRHLKLAEFNRFCRAFDRNLRNWHHQTSAGSFPERRYFYGTLKARAIGWGGLALLTGAVLLTFALGTGMAPMIAIVFGGGGLPIFLKMALGQRPEEPTG